MTTDHKPRWKLSHKIACASLVATSALMAPSTINEAFELHARLFPPANWTEYDYDYYTYTPKYSLVPAKSAEGYNWGHSDGGGP